MGGLRLWLPVVLLAAGAFSARAAHLAAGSGDAAEAADSGDAAEAAASASAPALAAAPLGLRGSASRVGASGAKEGAQPLGELKRRAQRAAEALRGAEHYYQREVAPVERVLRRFRDQPELTRRIALSLVREAHASGLEPRLLLAVLLVENPWLDPSARSPVGAVGLMQVMPLHRGQWGDCEPDLRGIESNICHGARIFAAYLRSSNGDAERALLRYNGCVRGTNTPDCHQYPYHVYARAGRASILAWVAEAGGLPGSAAAP